MADAVQSIISVTHLKPIIVVNAALPPHDVILIFCHNARRILYLRYLPCRIMGIRN